MKNGGPMTTSQQPFTQADLRQFTGSEVIYKHPMFNIRYTEGVRYVAQNAGAYWLIDAIASWQMETQVREDEMLQEIQFWMLTVNPDHSARLVCERDVGDVAVTQAIPYSDFPLSELKLYLEGDVLFTII